jgi:ABC-2 type transport system permease protein
LSTFVEIFRFELAHRVRHWSTWLYFATMAGTVWLLLIDLMIGESAGSGAVHANAPATVAMAMTIGTMVMLIATAGLFGEAAARDVESRMHSLLYAMPLSKRGYLAGRFFGAFTLNALLLLAGTIGLLFVEAERGGGIASFGAFRPMAYAGAYLLFALPTLFATGAIVFACAALTGRTVAAYGAAAFLFFGPTFGRSFVAPQAGGKFLGALLEPFGFEALGQLTEYWTAFETNTRLVPLAGALLWNRVAWVAAGAAGLALTHFRFRFADRARRRRKDEHRRATTPDALQESNAMLVVPTAPQSFGTSSRLRQTLAVASQSVRDVFLRPLFVAPVTLLLALIVKAGWQSAGIVLDTPTWPMTYLVARDVLGDVGDVLVVLSALVAGELIWRERDSRTSDILDAAPVPNAVSLTGKFAAMAIWLAGVQAILMVAGIVLQWMNGYRAYEPLLYAKIMFGIQLPHYLLWAALAFFVHVLVNQKYAAHLVVVMYWALCRFARSAIGIEHNLLSWAADPGWSYSDLSGFEPFLAGWLSFKSYWAAWALLLLVLANLLWVRGRDTRVRDRLREAKARFTPRMALATTIATLVVLATGGWILYNTNIVNEYRTSTERQNVRAGYERRYKRYETLPQPLIAHTSLNVELHPERRSADVRGTYLLENRTTAAIDTIHVLLDEDVDSRTLVFDRATRRLSHDRRHRYDIYALDRPLQPGQTMQLRFHVASAPRGFTNRRAGGEVVGNGTYFDRSWLPMIGYQPELELSDPGERKQHGLGPQTHVRPLDDAEGRRISSAVRDAHWQHVETVIGTAADQIAVAPGSLRRTWSANPSTGSGQAGRRYFHYATDAPIPNLYSFHSAAYAVREERWHGVLIQILHHPRHTYNLDRIMRGAKASLDYHTRVLGPYPYRELRIVEFPRYRGTYARAYPGVIAMSEAFGFMARPENGIDYPFLIAAHEVSHQWWGNQFRPARVEGGQVLSETLAHYSAMVVMEQQYGPEPLVRLRRMFLRNYLLGRRNHRTSEVPLLRSTDHKYLHYDKGAMVMYALRDALGEERIETALRRLFTKHRFAGPPYPTTRDLYAELYAVTPTPLRALLHDLFESITLWDLQVKQPHVEPLAGGAWRVTFTVAAEKFEADSIGRERAVPMNDLIDVGVFTGPTVDGNPGQPLYLQKHRLHSGSQTITVTVPRAPARVAIDPYHKLIERELSDDTTTNNVAEIAQLSGTPR